MGKRNRPGKREREQARREEQVEALQRDLAAETHEERRAALRSELALIALRATAFRERKLPKPKSAVPIPRSYVEEVRRKREEAHKVSGFDRIRARFVPGGVPGSGKRS